MTVRAVGTVVYAGQCTHIEWLANNYYVVPYNPERETLGPFPELQAAIDTAMSIDATYGRRINWWRVGAILAALLSWLPIALFVWFLWATPWPPAGWGKHVRAYDCPQRQAYRCDV